MMIVYYQSLVIAFIYMGLVSRNNLFGQFRKNGYHFGLVVEMGWIDLKIACWCNVLSSIIKN
jgi:hypothetical protein